MTDEQQNLTNDEQADETEHSPTGSVNVNVNEAVGAIILGVIALILLIALLRAQARNKQQSEE